MTVQTYITLLRKFYTRPTFLKKIKWHIKYFANHGWKNYNRTYYEFPKHGLWIFISPNSILKSLFEFIVPHEISQIGDLLHGKYLKKIYVYYAKTFNKNMMQNALINILNIKVFLFRARLHLRELGCHVHEHRINTNKWFTTIWYSKEIHNHTWALTYFY
jgi:hypothetical protein